VRPLCGQARAVALLVLLAVAGCGKRDADVAAAPPHLPAGEAGEVLRRAFDAAGGWERWMSSKDVSYIATLNLLDLRRQVSSESIGWYMAPLHRGAVARMDSIGLPSEVRFGIHEDQTWIVSDGREVLVPGQLAVTRFDMVSNLFWFSLPFLLAELPGEIEDLGTRRSPEGATWHLVKVAFDAPQPAVPGEWFVLYFDTKTWLIDRVHARLTAPFLRHETWVGKWLHYRRCEGFAKERQRQFFPADEHGEIIGELVAEQFVEHVRFNTGFPPEHFAKPPTGAKPEPA
jgi:hypothetical protein